MVIDSKGKMFEERRKADRRGADENKSKDVKKDKRKKSDRRNPKNDYKA